MEYFKARRMASTKWLASTVLDRGELGFETDTHRSKIGDGSTPWSALAYLDAIGTVPSRVEYGTVRFGVQNESITPYAFRPVMERQAPHILQNYATSYNKCSWDIWESGGPGDWKGLQFDTAAELYTFLAANCSQVGSPGFFDYTVMGRLYDVVDDRIPAINKLYGLNQFYSILTGRRLQRKGKPYTMFYDPGNPLGTRWSDFPAWFAQVCNQNLGLPAGGTWVLGASHEKTLWFSRTPRIRYGMPHLAMTMNLGGIPTSTRWVYDSATLTWLQDTDFSGYRFESEHANPYVWASLDISTVPAGSRTLYDVAGGYGNVMDAMSDRNLSFVCLLRMVNASIATRHGILIKPCGQDRIATNYFDSTQYDLVAYHENFDVTPRLKLIQGLPTTFQNVPGDFVWMTKPDWHPYGVNASTTRFSFNQTSQEPRRVRFFLRDKVSNKISPLSRMCIQATLGERLSPVKWMVRSV